mmetsp:Transcript_22892/g.52578  ORF Transcript_22892/g.52578 Transcript_22892/m.52578 type:complete len:217 (+) Transcript_22892:535-1185(+)
MTWTCPAGSLRGITRMCATLSRIRLAWTTGSTTTRSTSTTSTARASARTARAPASSTIAWLSKAVQTTRRPYRSMVTSASPRAAPPNSATFPSPGRLASRPSARTSSLCAQPPRGPRAAARPSTGSAWTRLTAGRACSGRSTPPPGWTLSACATLRGARRPSAGRRSGATPRLSTVLTNGWPARESRRPGCSSRPSRWATRWPCRCPPSCPWAAPR